MNAKAILAYLATILTAIAGIFLYGKKSGRDDLKAKLNEQTLNDIKQAQQVDTDISKLSDDELDARLRQHQRRRVPLGDSDSS